MNTDLKTHCDACHCSGVVCKPGIKEPARLSDLMRCDVCYGEHGGWNCDVCEIEAEMAADEDGAK